MLKSLLSGLAFAALFCPFALTAQDGLPPRPSTLRFLIESGLEYGGDPLATLYYTNGNEQTMRAGQGAYLAVGGDLQIASAPGLLFRATVGLKYNTTAAENANIRLTRFPVNAMAYYRIADGFRLGAGATTHRGINFKGDDFLPDLRLSSSVGPRFEFGYRWIALTYTNLKYTDGANQAFSASSVGLSVSATLPNSY